MMLVRLAAAEPTIFPDQPVPRPNRDPVSEAGRCAWSEMIKLSITQVQILALPDTHSLHGIPIFQAFIRIIPYSILLEDLLTIMCPESYIVYYIPDKAIRTWPVPSPGFAKEAASGRPPSILPEISIQAFQY